MRPHRRRARAVPPNPQPRLHPRPTPHHRSPRSQPAAAPAPPVATARATGAPAATPAPSRSAAALDAAVTRLGLDDDLRRVARLAANLPGIERLNDRKLADFAASRDAPAIARQLFEDLPDQVQGPLGQLTMGDFIKKYGA